MTEKEFYGIWNYYLSIENDLANTSRYIEPAGQEKVYSFEFAKILILACAEIESVFQVICLALDGKKVGDISEYKRIILSKYPKIVDATVSVSRLGKHIRPYSEWSSGPLSWWNAYQEVKHSRQSNFALATYWNALNAIAALYILIFYLAKIENFDFRGTDSQYIYSKYAGQLLACKAPEDLPDFCDSGKAEPNEVLDLQSQHPG